MRICLASAVWRNFGGWPSTARHLAIGLQEQGAEVGVYVPADAKELPLGGWRDILSFQGKEFLSGADAVILLILPTESAFLQELNGILKPGARRCIILHDPTDWRRRNALKFLKHFAPSLLCFFGARCCLTWQEEAGIGARAVIIPHPYQRQGGQAGEGERTRLISTARVDFDKNTHWLTQANEGIEIWTGYADWRYEYQHWGKPGIKSYSYYKGKFGFSDEEIAAVYSGALALVDLSVIKGDGGRTQYTFLEAMDFGLDLILHQSWGSGEIAPLIHYWPVGSVDELRATCQAVRSTGNVHQQSHAEILHRHEAHAVSKRLLEHLI